MFTLPNFCRVCLKHDKNLIDLAHIENEPSETLMSKLQLCVSEVEWAALKPLLCHPCIKRLNIAYSFRKQCVQSAGVLKNYIELVKESQKKNESQKTESGLSQPGAYMLLPNHKFVKILVGSQNQKTTGNVTSLPNVFFNLIPTTTVTPIENTSTQKNKDSNQNVFLNLNNTLQKLVAVTSVDPPPLKRSDPVKKENFNQNVNVSQLLNDSKAEEMSVEIDPTSFLSLEHDAPSSSEDDTKNDWDEVITKQKIVAKQAKINGTSNIITSNGKGVSPNTGNFVPILPKEDFFSGGHFLSTSNDTTEIACEPCQKSFLTKKLLIQHIKQFHMGKKPFKCEYCYTEFLTRIDYQKCIKSHLIPEPLQNTSLTLKDFSGHPALNNDKGSLSLVTDTPADHNLEPNENGEFTCDVCKRIFNSSSGLLRHRVRKHNQKNRKKYFIKGMKNARCDICNRDFSTQSYMQLHRKLHMRDDAGYKYKVLGKSRYRDINDSLDEDSHKSKDAYEGEFDQDDNSENVDVTPDIASMQMQDESESESDYESNHKKRKIDHGDTSLQNAMPESSLTLNDQKTTDKDSESSGEDSGDTDRPKTNE